MGACCFGNVPGPGPADVTATERSAPRHLLGVTQHLPAGARPHPGPLCVRKGGSARGGRPKNTQGRAPHVAPSKGTPVSPSLWGRSSRRVTVIRPQAGSRAWASCHGAGQGANGDILGCLGTFWGAQGQFGECAHRDMGSGLQEGQVMVRMAEPPSFPPTSSVCMGTPVGGHCAPWGIWGGHHPLPPDPLLVPLGTLPRVGQSRGGHGGQSHQREVLGCPGVPRRGCEPRGGHGGAMARRCPQVSTGGRGLSAVPPSIPQLSRSRRGR